MVRSIEDTLESMLDAMTHPDDVEAERLHRKQRLAAGLRILGRLNLAEGLAGHVTVRDPEFPDRFWVNPFGHNFKLMTVSDLICVDHTGEVVVGDRPVNTAAFAIHSELHKARPDVLAAAHTHSMYGRTFSSMGTPLRMITQDHTMFWNDIAYCDVGSGEPVVDTEISAKMAASLGDNKCMIHQNHGIITTGASVDAAIWWFVSLERCCQSQLLAEAAGNPIEVSDEVARRGWEIQGSEMAGWYSFQPFYDELVAREPEFLD